MLRTASADAARWNRSGQPLRVAVNRSPVQVTKPGLSQLVIDVLAEAGLAPELLELEITEGALMEQSDAPREVLQALHAHGVQIALGDCGTGYSSLAYLTRMPINSIKIDRCFVADLLQGGESAAVVRGVLAMACSLGIRVTAEGVETLRQVETLRNMSCDCRQGFCFSQAVSSDRIPGLRGHCWAFGVQSVSNRSGHPSRAGCSGPNRV